MIEFSIQFDALPTVMNLDKLGSEIAASGLVPNFAGATLSAGTLTITGDTQDRSTLLSLIQAHDPISLAEYKAIKNLTIDSRTQMLIANGFAFDSHGFSLSPQAQMNWSGLKTFEALLTWPTKITAKGDLEYTLSQANLVPFVGAALVTVAYHYTNGRALKLQVNAATSKDEVDSVVDSR